MRGIDAAIQVIAVLALGFCGYLLFNDWPRLPETVPVHFGPNGLPDAWGSKRTLLMLPGLALGIFVTLTVLERLPHRLEYAWPITPDNAARQYAIARRMLATLKAVITWVLALGFARTCAVALGQADGLGSWFLAGSLLAILGPLSFFVVQAFRAR